jgi:hypothetical protein
VEFERIDRMLELNEKTYNFQYERNASTSYLVVETGYEASISNYQVEMIANNPNTGALPLNVRRADNSMKLYYDITSKVSLEWLLKRKSLNKHEFIGILCGIAKPLLEASGYFLKESSFVLNENCIFVSPDLTEISRVYLPVLSETDYLKNFKELALKLITDLTEIEESPGDNYLQRIIGNIKEEGFSILTFDRLLKELSFKQSAEAVFPQIEKQDNKGVEPLLIPPQKSDKVRAGSEKKTVTDIVSTRINRRHILIILLQILFILIAWFLLKSRILGSITKTDPTSAYAGLLLVAGAIDFLAVRGILSRKGSSRDDEAYKKSTATSDIVKPVNLKPKESKPKLTAERKSKFITIEKKDSDDTIFKNQKEDTGREEKTFTVERNSYKTEFLSVSKDIRPYLKGGKEGTNEKIIIGKGQFSIGRLEGQVDYCCSNNSIGKLHAEIILREGLYFIKDLNSRNGTFVNNQRIDSNTEYEIKNNDRVALANSEYVFIVP